MAMKKEAQDKAKAEALRKAEETNVSLDIKVPIIWVLGGPGCGKGTQCAKIVEKYGFTHLSSGDLLREEVASGSDKGRELQAIMSSGGLVSNDEVLLLLERAIQIKKGMATGFLIDGYPREESQGAAFERRIGPCDLLIYLECSDHTMHNRISTRATLSAIKRADDNDATIKTRLETFRNNTNAILTQYTEKTLTLNAERDVDVIFDDVCEALDCIIKKKSAISMMC